MGRYLTYHTTSYDQLEIVVQMFAPPSHSSLNSELGVARLNPLGQLGLIRWGGSSRGTQRLVPPQRQGVYNKSCSPSCLHILHVCMDIPWYSEALFSRHSPR